MWDAKLKYLQVSSASCASLLQTLSVYPALPCSRCACTIQLKVWLFSLLVVVWQSMLTAIRQPQQHLLQHNSRWSPGLTTQQAHVAQSAEQCMTGAQGLSKGPKSTDSASKEQTPAQTDSPSQQQQQQQTTQQTVAPKTPRVGFVDQQGAEEAQTTGPVSGGDPQQGQGPTSQTAGAADQQETDEHGASEHAGEDEQGQSKEQQAEKLAECEALERALLDAPSLGAVDRLKVLRARLDRLVASLPASPEVSHSSVFHKTRPVKQLQYPNKKGLGFRVQTPNPNPLPVGGRVVVTADTSNVLWLPLGQ